jgi:NAD-dependent SIR2 family protein deacetylase
MPELQGGSKMNICKDCHYSFDQPDKEKDDDGEEISLCPKCGSDKIKSINEDGGEDR